MDLEKLKKIIEMLEDSSLHKLQLKDGDEELLLEKESTSHEITSIVSPIQHSVPVSPHIIHDNFASTSPSTTNEETKIEETPKASDYTVVVSPLVGIYYEASAPEQPAFVEVGSQVKVGDTLCIIEAMKVLNEIKASVAGEVKAIHVKNGDILSYNQTLIEIGE
ncbi:MAG: acetyl-CoA carboxylase biotin carboxyl carrier protein [Oscillospiraceae bacterium]|nr:acetyl-CoA carboxylase biotin carboxyl carrier protein [Oscillospiraceae bacterium]